MSSEFEEQNSKLFDEVWNNMEEKLPKVIVSPQEDKFLHSLAMGGTVAAELFVNNCAGIRPYWREGSLVKANDTCLLFSFIMLSQTYRWINTQPDHDETSNLPKEVISTKLIYIFNTIAERWMEEFQKFDAQFNYDLDNHPHIIHLSGLIIAKLCSSYGHQCLDWSKVNFPVHEFKDIVTPGVLIDGAPFRDQQDINVVATAISTGIDAMNKYMEQE